MKSKPREAGPSDQFTSSVDIDIRLFIVKGHFRTRLLPTQRRTSNDSDRLNATASAVVEN